MENKELETWLKETKAKNLSKEDLKYCTISLDSVFYNKLRKELKVVGTLYEHLFNQWQKESEFSPKRGDRVLVWNDNDDPIERIFLAKIKGLHDPIIFVAGGYEDLFKNNELFDNAQFQHMKPLPTEQPTETDFKSKAIELIRDRIVIANNNLYDAVQNKLYDDAAIFQKDSQKLVELLNEIIKLC